MVIVDFYLNFTGIRIPVLLTISRFASDYGLAPNRSLFEVVTDTYMRHTVSLGQAIAPSFHHAQICLVLLVGQFPNIYPWNSYKAL